MTSSATLIAEGIHKSFGDLNVLKGISLEAYQGDVISILGSSGSGKSTLLRCINFLETPDQGRIVLDGEEVRIEGRRLVVGTFNDRKKILIWREGRLT